MSLFGSLYVGTSGLQTSQNALNTTAHNMSNLDTKGYSRQQILLGTRTYNTLSVSASAVAPQQTGLGVYYSRVRQVRDQFLDQTYRKESGRSMFYESSASALEEIEDLFGEFQGVEFSEALSNLGVSIDELSKQPGLLTNQNLFVFSAGEFIERAGLVYKGLCDKQDNMNDQIKKNVDQINKYGEQIMELNQKIMRIEAGGIEKANDLRDTRNVVLDELSKLTDITYSEDLYGSVSVKMEGIDFVRNDTLNKVAVYRDAETGFYTPYWSQLAETKLNDRGEEVIDLDTCSLYDPKQPISSEFGSTVGSMRALIVARGDKRATFKDLQDQDYYEENIAQSIMMNVMAEFDQLVNKVATIINQVLKEAAESEPDTDYMKDENGNPYQLFETISPDPNEGFTCGNILMNDKLKRDPSLLSFLLKDGSEDKATTEKLLKAFKDENHTLNPSLKTPTNLIKYYNNLVSQVAENGEIYRGIADSQQLMVNEIGAAREQIVGVSADEEMEFMIKFQNAYNASSRYINVISEMMEHVIMTMGR